MKRVLMIILFLFPTLVFCQVTPSNTARSVVTTIGTIDSVHGNSGGRSLKTIGFEDQKEFFGWGMEAASNNAITISRKYKRTGNSSGRFQVNLEDIDVAGSKRCEMKQRAEETNFESWYGFSQLFPKEFIFDSTDDIVGQWHDIPDFDLGETWRVPPVTLVVKNDSFHFSFRWAIQAINSRSGGGTHSDGEAIFNLGKVPKEKWINWVFHIKFSYQQDGIVEVWKNGVKVVDRKGPNSYNDEHAPYFKFGIYKWPWKRKPNLSTVSQRVLYYDAVKIGDANSNYKEVSP